VPPATAPSERLLQGPVTSTITSTAGDEARLGLPAASVAIAVKLYVPSPSVKPVSSQIPLPSAVSVPTGVAPLSTCTEEPASAVPDIEVISVFRGLVIGSMVGAAGAVVSTTNVNVVL
jgi:hypothetical protein